MHGGRVGHQTAELPGRCSVGMHRQSCPVHGTSPQNKQPSSHQPANQSARAGSSTPLGGTALCATTQSCLAELRTLPLRRPHLQVWRASSCGHTYAGWRQCCVAWHAGRACARQHEGIRAQPPPQQAQREQQLTCQEASNGVHSSNVCHLARRDASERLRVPARSSADVGNVLCAASRHKGRESAACWCSAAAHGWASMQSCSPHPHLHRCPARRQTRAGQAHLPRQGGPPGETGLTIWRYPKLPSGKKSGMMPLSPVTMSRCVAFSPAGCRMRSRRYWPNDRPDICAREGRGQRRTWS